MISDQDGVRERLTIITNGVKANEIQEMRYMAKDSLRARVVKDVKAAEKAIVSEEKAIVTKIRTRAPARELERSKAPDDEHIQEET